MEDFGLDNLDFDAAEKANAEAQTQADAEAAALVADNDCGDACKI